MINITNSAIVEKIKGTGRTFTLSIKVGTNTFTKVKSLRRSSIFASNQKLSVGEAVSAFIEAEINDCRESLQNYEVEPILSIDGYNIPLGIFKVQAPSQADGSGTQKITAYDRMSETSKYTYKATGLTGAISTFQAICTTCGYTADISGLTDVSINDRLLDGLDCRKALGYVAGVFGKNCVVTTDGKFKMLGYSKIAESTCKISINSLDTLEFPSKVSTIDYFNAVVDEATIYKSGTGNNGVNVVNPLFKGTTQTYNILTYLKSNVGSNGYYPAKFKQLNGDPRIELGDVIKVEHRNIVTGEVGADYVPVMSLVLDYDGGVAVSIEAYPTESEFSMSLSDKMDLTNSSNNNKFEDLADDIGKVNNKVDGFEEDIEEANTKADFATVRAEAVEELNKVVSSSLGLYQTQKEGVGGDVKYYFHNKPTLEESTYIISMTDQGFAFTNSWSENESEIVWTYGINPAGNSIMNYLIVNKISADLIEAGVIKSLDGAPIKSDFSLNTGKFTLESNSQNEKFGFGANRNNHLLLQYNYSDGNKKGVALGYYYDGRFYEDSAHTELIEASEDCYYGDIPSGDFYQYSSGAYSKLTDLSDVYKTYKGFIMHSIGYTQPYVVDETFGILSDFNANLELFGGLFGIYESGDVERRTPILKFYDFENESANGGSHYTAIRKQSIVTKQLGAETFCFYLDGKVTDLETLLKKIISAIKSSNDEIVILKSEIKKLQETLGTKSLTVYVLANPENAGVIESGTGSYTLEDGNFIVEAYRLNDYYISGLTLVYKSDGATTTYSKAQLLSSGWLNSSETRLEATLPVESSRLGDTLNITVQFSEPEKYILTVSADPTSGGTVSGGGSYTPNIEAKISAAANNGYEFVGWYENGSLQFSTPSVTIIMSSDRTLTAKFEKVETETESMTVKLTNGSNSASKGDSFFFSNNNQGTDDLGTERTFVKGGGYLYMVAKPGTDRKITEYKVYVDGVLQGTQSLDQTSIWSAVMAYAADYKGKTVEYVMYFDDADTSGGDTETTYYTVSTAVSPSGAGSVTGGGRYAKNASVSLTATPASGYVFSHWNVTNNDIGQSVENASTDNPWNITVTINMTVTAVFTATSGGDSSEVATIKVTTSGATSGDSVYIDEAGITEKTLPLGTQYKIYAYSTNGYIGNAKLLLNGVVLGEILDAGETNSTGDGWEYSGTVVESNIGNQLEYQILFTH